MGRGVAGWGLGGVGRGLAGWDTGLDGDGWGRMGLDGVGWCMMGLDGVGWGGAGWGRLGRAVVGSEQQSTSGVGLGLCAARLTEEKATRGTGREVERTRCGGMGSGDLPAEGPDQLARLAD